MDRAFESGASGTPPTPPASPSTGYPTNGNPGTATPATQPGEWWFYQQTEELRNLVVAAGLTPDRTNVTQVAQAVQTLIAAGAANDYKASVRAATTANIAALAGGAPNTLDGVTLAANDRILVKDQTTASQNGIYYVSTLGTGANGTWTRATDADGLDELTSGAIVAVEQGSVNADSQWMLTTDGTITIGTTSLTFAIRGNSTVKQIQSITSSVAGNQLTVGLNPTTLDFRSATLTTGVPNTRTVGSALTLVVPASATLGTVSATQARLALLAIDNAGTVELAIVNLAGGVNLDETTLISTTAISAAATSASVVYSTTARTNVPFRVVGFLDITETTAGTWATDATTKQGAGGNVIRALGPTQSAVRVNTANGYGSTNTMIRRFTTVVLNQGTDITYADSATLGASFTINASGLYAINYSDSFTTTNDFGTGISLNSSQLTIGVGSINIADRLSVCGAGAGSVNSNASALVFLPAGSVIRPHGQALATGPYAAVFNITRVG